MSNEEWRLASADGGVIVVRRESLPSGNTPVYRVTCVDSIGHSVFVSPGNEEGVRLFARELRRLMQVFAVVLGEEATDE